MKSKPLKIVFCTNCSANGGDWIWNQKRQQSANNHTASVIIIFYLPKILWNTYLSANICKSKQVVAGLLGLRSMKISLMKKVLCSKIPLTNILLLCDLFTFQKPVCDTPTSTMHEVKFINFEKKNVFLDSGGTSIEYNAKNLGIEWI